MADGAVFLAVDLGAGSGRIIAGLMLGGRLSLEEVYRFENEPVEKNGNLYYIAYQVMDSEEKIIIATTRPETLLGDTAVCIHP